MHGDIPKILNSKPVTHAPEFNHSPQCNKPRNKSMAPVVSEITKFNVDSVYPALHPEQRLSSSFSMHPVVKYASP
jgi:hypothetical protein